MKNQKKSWFENEEFWLNYAPIMFDENRWAESFEVARYVKKIANLKKGDKILDAGCGVGRISVELAKLGLDVTGIDLIQSELDAAKETAQDEGVHLNLVKADLRNFATKNPDSKNFVQKYDCAVNLYTSFGYCDTIEEDMKILKNIFESLKTGGTFILENLSRETAIMQFTEGETFERAGKTVVTKFCVSGAWEGLRSSWTLLDSKSKIEHVFTQRLYSAADLREKILQCGFSKAEVFGNFDKRPYDQNALTMVIVATK